MFTNISMKLDKSSIKEWLYEKSNYNLHQSFRARHSKQTVGNFSKQRTNQLFRLERSELKNIIAFYTEHGKFRRHLHTMKITTDSQCKFCKVNETAEYVHCKKNYTWPVHTVTQGLFPRVFHV